MSIKGLMDKQNVVDPYNEILSCLKNEENFDTWMNLEDVKLNAISQAQKDECCMVPLR